MSRENWKPVLGHEGRYEVSDLGRVRSLARTIKDSRGKVYRREDRILAHVLFSAGYEGVGLYAKGKQSCRTVHSLVCEAFHGKKPAWAQCVRHLDGNSGNNAAANLAWGTHKENIADQYRHGSRGYGEDSPRSVLTNENVREIRNAYKHGVVTYAMLGAQYGVCQSTIMNAVKGHCFAGIE